MAAASSYANPNAVSQNDTPGSGPISDPASWDYITLAGRRSPGVVPPGGVDFHRVHKWDKKEGKGTIGGTPTYTNRPPAEGTITFVLWTDAHFRAWDNFILLFDYDPTKKPTTGLDVDHPELRRLKIKSLCIEKIGTIKDVGAGKYEVKIDAFEWTPPPKDSAVSTPKGSKTGNGDPSANDPTKPPNRIAEHFAEKQREDAARQVQRRTTKP